MFPATAFEAVSGSPKKVGSTLPSRFQASVSLAKSVEEIEEKQHCFVNVGKQVSLYV